jgi:hypothetical protein
LRPEKNIATISILLTGDLKRRKRKMGKELGSHYLDTSFTGTTGAFLSGGVFPFVPSDTGTASPLGDQESC